MAQTTGLGRGLGSLIPSRKNAKAPVADAADLPKLKKNMSPKQAEPVAQKQPEIVNESNVRILEISPSDVVANPYQPRKIFKHEDLADLVESIKKHGLMQPLTVTEVTPGKFELIAGERRLRASRIAELEKVPVIVREAGDLEKLELALIENIQRQDLNPIEKAESYFRLIDEFGVTQEEAAKRLGKSRSSVANTMRLLSLPEDIQRALADGKITEGHARAILSLETPGQQKQLFQRIVNHSLNVRDTEKTAKSYRMKTRHVQPEPIGLEEKRVTLQQSLSTKVEVKPNGRKGKVTIHYYSDEELQRLVSIIKKGSQI